MKELKIIFTFVVMSLFFYSCTETTSDESCSSETNCEKMRTDTVCCKIDSSCVDSTK